jgi:hypothetical protein
MTPKPTNPNTLTRARRGAYKATPERFARLLKRIATGAPLAVCARAVGIGRTTLYDWRQDPALEAELTQALAVAEVENLARVQRGEPGWQGAAWILERRNPARWGRRETVTVEAKPVERMSREEVAAEAAKLAAEIAHAVQR